MTRAGTRLESELDDRSYRSLILHVRDAWLLFSLSTRGPNTVDILNESIPVEEIITALDDLVKSGKVRAIAASNISAGQLSASRAFSDRENLSRYVALQPPHNLVSGNTYEGPKQEIVESEGLACVPYFALASGFFTGKYRLGEPVEGVRNVPDWRLVTWIRNGA